MEDSILKSLLLRPGMEGREKDLEDMIHDSIIEMRGYLNYDDDEMLPEGCMPAVKELALIRFNQDGAEGLQSESQSSGGSITYTNILPDNVKRIIRRYRRLPG